jgi:hypothetical protein
MEKMNMEIKLMTKARNEEMLDRFERMENSSSSLSQKVSIQSQPRRIQIKRVNSFDDIQKFMVKPDNQKKGRITSQNRGTWKIKTKKA